MGALLSRITWPRPTGRVTVRGRAGSSMSWGRAGRAGRADGLAPGSRLGGAARAGGQTAGADAAGPRSDTAGREGPGYHRRAGGVACRHELGDYRPAAGGPAGEAPAAWPAPYQARIAAEVPDPGPDLGPAALSRQILAISGRLETLATAKQPAPIKPAVNERWNRLDSRRFSSKATTAPSRRY